MSQFEGANEVGSDFGHTSLTSNERLILGCDEQSQEDGEDSVLRNDSQAFFAKIYKEEAIKNINDTDTSRDFTMAT